MTITLTPKTEQALREAAARRGVTPDQLIEESLQEGPLSALMKTEAQADLKTRVKAARGSLAYLGPSTLMQTRQEERALEEKSEHRSGDTGR